VRVLLAGESWITYSVHIKGVDQFTQCAYEEGARWLVAGLAEHGIDCVHLPSHLAITQFPSLVEELAGYDCVILSDIGANTLLLHPRTTGQSRRTPNRLAALEEYVREGGGLIMIGGYMSFQGIEGKARYNDTPIEEVLPVEIMPYDDRAEVPEGFVPRVVDEAHPVLAGIPREWPFMLFYNRVRLKPEAALLLAHRDDPILAVWQYGRGRSAAFTPDCAPHGAPPEFLEWPYYGQFWAQLVRWVAD